MCGIAGFINLDGVPADEAVIRAMADALRARGPDDEGTFMQGPLALGFRRLSIIDLAGGHQPMSSTDGRLTIVFNGEIYNFPELRRDLEKRGYAFRTRSDTETILHGYDVCGELVPEWLNGMFAFALWDAGARRLLLARDRMGKKPLYYAHQPGRYFAFASELKALLRYPRLEPRLDLGGLRRYLAFDYVPDPHTIYEGVHKLPPGHRLVFEEGAARVEPYWDLQFQVDGRPPKEKDAAEELRLRLREAVRRRLLSDVPLGVFLSGGIDSSAVVAMMAELVPGPEIRTFSVGFREKSFDESSHARKVAAHFGTDHHEEMLEPEAMLDILPTVSAYLDEPVADASIIPTYLLARFTRQHVTVALGGDGGDELFLGYPTFFAHRLVKGYRHVPRLLRSVFRGAVEHLPVSRDNFSLDFKAKRFVHGAEYPDDVRHEVWLGSFDPLLQEELLTADVLEATRGLDVYDAVRALRLRDGFRDDFDALCYEYAKLYLGAGVLTKVDRASMAVSLEARAPLLDREVVDFVTRLPTRLKLRGRTTKYLLKKALRGKLPDQILDRPKKGFGVPLGHWIHGPLRPLFEEVLDPDRIRAAGLFRPAAVERLLAEHIAGTRDHRKLLWNLFMFESWRASYPS